MLDINMPHVTDKGLEAMVDAGINIGAKATKNITKATETIFNSRLSYVLVGILGCVVAYNIVIGIHKGASTAVVISTTRTQPC